MFMTNVSTNAMQRMANDAVWRGGTQVRAYANRVLRPVEVIILARYREELSQQVLELGCGAGRLTGYLAEIATHVHAIDLSAAMVEACRARYPAVSAEVRDMRELSAMAPASYDAVVAGFNVLDVLDDSDRKLVLDGIRTALRPGGELIMSSHNRAVVDRLCDPMRLRWGPPRATITRLVKLPRWRRNHRRLAAFERDEPRYAIRNDRANEFTALHYYISRDDQEAQLEDQGFELIECLDLEGRPVARGEAAAGSPELHYIARRAD
jgi:SAM-dependent methyltransferase